MCTGSGYHCTRQELRIRNNLKPSNPDPPYPTWVAKSVNIQKRLAKVFIAKGVNSTKYKRYLVDYFTNIFLVITIYNEITNH